MYKIMFVCLGNICRSPMAECIMSDLIIKNKLDDKVLVHSKGTSSEEYGNPIYPKAKSKLKEKGITVLNHYASKLDKSDYDKYDLFVGMEESNIRNMLRIFDGDKDNKIIKMQHDVSDPWYTDDFERAYNDIYEGCIYLLNMIKEK